MNIMILLMAGNSKRLDIDTKKQFLNLNGKPLFMSSIETILEVKNIDKIILVIKKEDEESKYIKDFLSSSTYNSHKNMIYITYGGEERYDSVRNSFVYIDENMGYNGDYKILIHDAARPFVKKEDIEKVIDALDKVSAVSLAGRCVDTVKKVKNEDGEIHEVVDTLNRDELYLIYTPQGFRYETIKKAYEEFEKYKSVEKITDDLQLVEKYTEENVYLLDSDRHNIKITTRDDLIYIN